MHHHFADTYTLKNHVTQKGFLHGRFFKNGVDFCVKHHPLLKFMCL